MQLAIVYLTIRKQLWLNFLSQRSYAFSYLTRVLQKKCVDKNVKIKNTVYLHCVLRICAEIKLSHG